MSKLHNIFTNYNKQDHPIITHNIHPYPAKYPPHIPYLLIKNYAEDNPDFKVLDPFMGSGTTVVESNFMGYKAIGNDINPLSPLLVKTKTTKLSVEDISLLEDMLIHINNLYDQKVDTQLIDFKGTDKWFKPHILYELSLLKNIINSDTYKHLDWFNTIVLSSIIVIVSNQDSDIRYCSHIKTANDVEGYAIQQFTRKLKKYIKDNQLLTQTYENYKLFNNNALTLESLEDNSVDMIITSPPYANTNDYFLNHRLRLLCFDMDYDFYRINEIGSHASFSSKKADISVWNFNLIDMMKTFNRVLKPNGNAFIIIGDTVWQRDLYKIDQFIKDACPESEFELKDIHSYNLRDISKSFNPSFADPNHIKQEHIIHIQKIGN